MNKTENYQKWRFWPIICLAFFYPVNGALVNLAIPLYYFKRGTNIEIIGFLAAGVTMTYCFSPMLLNSISEKINRRRSVILGIVGVSLAQIVFYFSLEPIPFLIARLVEGFMAGFIWSNLQSSITDNAHHNHSKYLAKYNLSWNAGVLGGYLLGAIVLYLVDNLEIIFYIAPLLVVSNAFIILFFFQESNKRKNNQNNQELKHLNRETNLDDNNLEKNYEKNKGNITDFTKYSIPVIVPSLYIISYCLIRGSVNFLYPIKSEILGFDTYTVYLLSFFGLSTQLISITLVSYLSIDHLKKIPIISLFALIIILIFFGLNSNFFIFLLLYLLLGIFSGTLHGASLKLFLALNMKNNTSKYSSLFESIIGFTFLITPIVAGFIARIDLNLAFYVMAIIFSIMFLANLIFIKKIQKIT